jgi:DNA-binding NarL/FixJ family response regulator
VIRVLIVDDHDFFRLCLVDLVTSAHDLVAVGECRDGSEVLETARALEPDVVLMDVRMGSRSGLEAADDLRQAGHRARVVLLTSDPVLPRRADAEARGVVGHLTKGVAGERVLEAVRSVAGGGTAWPEDTDPRAAGARPDMRSAR